MALTPHDIARVANLARQELRPDETDRVLLAERFWIPQWYNHNYWVAYYDMYDHPANLPPFGGIGELSFWWYDADKAAKLKASGVLH